MFELIYRKSLRRRRSAYGNAIRVLPRLVVSAVWIFYISLFLIAARPMSDGAMSNALFLIGAFFASLVLLIGGIYLSFLHALLMYQLSKASSSETQSG